MEKGGTILVSAENCVVESEDVIPLVPGNYVAITVKDEGCGIPPADMPKIFDPYFTTKQEGNGLGLATAYSIIQKHDGYINVESIVGRGTTFSLYLPSTPDVTVDRNPINGKEKENRAHTLQAVR